MFPTQELRPRPLSMPEAIGESPISGRAVDLPMTPLRGALIAQQEALNLLHCAIGELAEQLSPIRHAKPPQCQGEQGGDKETSSEIVSALLFNVNLIYQSVREIEAIRSSLDL